MRELPPVRPSAQERQSAERSDVGVGVESGKTPVSAAISVANGIMK
ncbi:hypothetical protein QFZ33_002163 [Arthrobacter globiformis]|nr:hypothetical protein [Arthrobacter globiformis]